MTESFASRVYPIILHVLDLKDRVDKPRSGREPRRADEIAKLKNVLGRLSAEGAGSKDLDLAKRALVYWIDDLMVYSKWSQAREWEHNSLEFELYKKHDRAWLFYQSAAEANALGGRVDALETYFLCVALGFRGIYRPGETNRGPAPSAAPAPADAPQVKAAANPEVTGFDDFPSVIKSADDSWGGITNPNQAPAEGVKRAIVDPGRGPTGVRQLPATLEEWAAGVFQRIAQGGAQPFQPTSGRESQRPASPLRGWSRLAKSLTAFAWLFFLALVFGGFAALIYGNVKPW